MTLGACRPRKIYEISHSPCGLDCESRLGWCGCWVGEGWERVLQFDRRLSASRSAVPLAQGCVQQALSRWAGEGGAALPEFVQDKRR